VVLLALAPERALAVRAAAAALCARFVAAQDLLVDQGRLEPFLAPLLEACVLGSRSLAVAQAAHGADAASAGTASAAAAAVAAAGVEGAGAGAAAGAGTAGKKGKRRFGFSILRRRREKAAAKQQQLLQQQQAGQAPLSGPGAAHLASISPAAAAALATANARHCSACIASAHASAATACDLGSLVAWGDSDVVLHYTEESYTPVAVRHVAPGAAAGTAPSAAPSAASSSAAPSAAASSGLLLLLKPEALREVHAARVAALRALAILFLRTDAQSLESRAAAAVPVLLDLLQREMEAQRLLLPVLAAAHAQGRPERVAVEADLQSSVSLMAEADLCLAAVASALNPATAASLYGVVFRYFDVRQWQPLPLALRMFRILDGTNLGAAAPRGTESGNSPLVASYLDALAASGSGATTPIGAAVSSGGPSTSPEVAQALASLGLHHVFFASAPALSPAGPAAAGSASAPDASWDVPSAVAACWSVPLLSFFLGRNGGIASQSADAQAAAAPVLVEPLHHAAHPVCTYNTPASVLLLRHLARMDELFRASYQPSLSVTGAAADRAPQPAVGPTYDDHGFRCTVAGHAIATAAAGTAKSSGRDKGPIDALSAVYPWVCASHGAPTPAAPVGSAVGPFAPAAVDLAFHRSRMALLSVTFALHRESGASAAAWLQEAVEHAAPVLLDLSPPAAPTGTGTVEEARMRLQARCQSLVVRLLCGALHRVTSAREVLRAAAELVDWYSDQVLELLPVDKGRLACLQTHRPDLVSLVSMPRQNVASVALGPREKAALAAAIASGGAALASSVPDFNTASAAAAPAWVAPSVNEARYRLLSVVWFAFKWLRSLVAHSPLPHPIFLDAAGAAPSSVGAADASASVSGSEGGHQRPHHHATGVRLNLPSELTVGLELALSEEDPSLRGLALCLWHELLSVNEPFDAEVDGPLRWQAEFITAGTGLFPVPAACAVTAPHGAVGNADEREPWLPIGRPSLLYAVRLPDRALGRLTSAMGHGVLEACKAGDRAQITLSLRLARDIVRGGGLDGVCHVLPLVFELCATASASDLTGVQTASTDQACAFAFSGLEALADSVQSSDLAEQLTAWGLNSTGWTVPSSTPAVSLADPRRRAEVQDTFIRLFLSSFRMREALAALGVDIDASVVLAALSTQTTGASSVPPPPSPGGPVSPAVPPRGDLASILNSPSAAGSAFGGRHAHTLSHHTQGAGADEEANKRAGEVIRRLRDAWTADGTLLPRAQTLLDLLGDVGGTGAGSSAGHGHGHSGSGAAGRGAGRAGGRTGAAKGSAAGVARSASGRGAHGTGDALIETAEDEEEVSFITSESDSLDGRDGVRAGDVPTVLSARDPSVAPLSVDQVSLLLAGKGPGRSPDRRDAFATSALAAVGSSSSWIAMSPRNALAKLTDPAVLSDFPLTRSLLDPHLRYTWLALSADPATSALVDDSKLQMYRRFLAQ
jgi:hypothetical protein